MMQATLQDPSASQEMPRTPGNRQMLEEKDGEVSSSEEPALPTP